VADRHVICANRRRHALLLITAVVFAAIGVWVLSDVGLRVWWAWACVLGFGAFGVPIFARELLRHRPRIVLDEEGIWARGLREPIAWRDVEIIFDASGHSARFLGLEPRGPSSMTSQPALVRLMAPLNRRLTGAPVTIAINHLDRSPDEIVRLALRFRERAA
jgi:hypothetical protein